MKITIERLSYLVECETKLNLVTEFRKQTLKLLGRAAFADAIDIVLGLEGFANLVKKEAEERHD